MAKKVSQLPTVTTLTDDDYLMTVDAPAGTPVTSKITVGNARVGLIDFALLAANPDQLIVGAITRDANGAAVLAGVEWPPDGTPGTYTATTVSTLFPGAVDAYTITYGSPLIRTYTQPAVTRDATGAVTVRPAITVTEA